MEICAIIPARGGSKSIPLKNIAPLNGKPLIEYTITAAKKSQLINRLFVSTDDIQITNVCRSLNVNVESRPYQLCTDSAKTIDVIDYHLKELKKHDYSPDIFVILQPTSPLRTEIDIDACLNKLISTPSADSIVSVIQLPHQYSPEKIMYLSNEGSLKFYAYDGEKYSTRQELPTYYARNGAAIYATRTESFYKNHSLYGSYCLPYIMPSYSSIDIDTYDDLQIAELLLKNKRT